MKLSRRTAVLLLLLVCSSVFLWTSADGLIPPSRTRTTNRRSSNSSSRLHHAAAAKKLSDLPQGISPFERSLSKSMDVQADFRNRAKRAVDAASAKVELMEIEFPPLLGGDRSKSQFDDFDNVQELDKNKDWTVQFAPLLGNGKRTWLIFPDLKECELAKKEWKGARYRDAATFTTIEAVTNYWERGSYDAPWGANFVSGVSQLLGGKGGDAGLLGNLQALDPLDDDESTKTNAPPKVNLVCQPGNGGPVEDWINVEKIHLASSPPATTIIVNGALDKVRGGYYPAVFFPKLAATVNRFYNQFQSVFYLKPISDKGLYGWLYRVYPEPWQVVLQTVKTGKGDRMFVEDAVVYVSEKRPTYNEAVAKLVEGSKQLA